MSFLERVISEVYDEDYDQVPFIEGPINTEIENAPQQLIEGELVDLDAFRAQRDTEIAIRIYANPHKNLGMLFSHSIQGDARATEALVRQFSPLALGVANKYAGNREAEFFEEVSQVAMVGLFKAVSRCDETRGIGSFIPYARLTIEGEVKKYFRDYCWGMHVARPLKEAALKIKNTQRDAERKGEFDLSIQDIASRLDITYEEALEAWTVLKTGFILDSLNRHINDAESDEETELADTLIHQDDKDTDFVFNKVALDVEIRELLEGLSDDDQQIFIQHILLDKTKTQVARDLKIHPMRIERLFDRIAKHGRQHT